LDYLKNKRSILIIDGYNMIHRCRFQWGGGLALGEFQVVYNFFRTLRATIEQFNPDLVYFPLDGKPAARLAMYPAYKGNRKIETDDPEEIAYWESFRRQKRLIIDSLESAYPVTTVFHADHECDDLILFLIENYCLNDDTTIISSDTDFIQILNSYPESVKLYNPLAKSYRQNTEYDYISWKAMVGDKADNIPGVRGIGKKTAAKILGSEGELEKRLEDSSFRDEYNISYELIKLMNIEEDFNLEISKSSLDEEAIKDSFERMGFDSMLREEYLIKYFDTFTKL
jgi:DNA polymerase-1